MPKLIYEDTFFVLKSSKLIYAFNAAQVSCADHHVKALLAQQIIQVRMKLTFIIIVYALLHIYNSISFLMYVICKLVSVSN